MAVSLTISETLDGTQIADALADSSSGTTNSGLDYGTVTNGVFAPLTDQVLNTGAQHLYIQHDATIDPITNVKFHLEAFSGANGYGGADSAANDLTTILTMGNDSAAASPTPTKNNDNGKGEGVWFDMDADVSTTNQFDWATNGNGEGGNDTVAMFGQGGGVASGLGSDLATAFTCKADAMVYNLPGETVGTVPVDGKIGKAGDTVLGDAAHLKSRIYISTAFSQGGIFQMSIVSSFSYTAQGVF